MEKTANAPQWRSLEKALFTLFVGALLVTAIVVAWEWPVRASIIVLVLGSIGILLTLVQFLSDLQGIAPDAVQADALSLEAPAVESSGRWGDLEIWGCIIGFFILIQLVGFLYAIPLFVFLYSKGYGGGWLLSIVLALCAWGFVYAIFGAVLHVPWPDPLIGVFKI
jgi:hypothetical protein